MARLLSVNVGLPRDVTWNGKTVRTAVWKIPVPGRLTARKLNIDGDGQGDLAGHGGEQRAVFVYQMDSYHFWERFLGRNDFSFGQFGENFTVDGLLDDEVCIGDRYRIGNALFEVTAPRESKIPADGERRAEPACEVRSCGCRRDSRLRVALSLRITHYRCGIDRRCRPRHRASRQP